MKTLLLSAAAAALLASAPAAFAQDQDQEHHEHDRGAQPQAQHQPQGQPHAQAPGQPVGGQPNARAGAGIPAPNNPGWRRGSSPGQAGPQGGQGAPGGQNQFRPDNRGGQNPNPGGGRPDYQNHEGRDHGGPNGGGFDQNRGDRNGPGFDQNRGRPERPQLRSRQPQLRPGRAQLRPQWRAPVQPRRLRPQRPGPAPLPRPALSPPAGLLLPPLELRPDPAVRLLRPAVLAGQLLGLWPARAASGLRVGPLRRRRGPGRSRQRRGPAGLLRRLLLTGRPSQTLAPGAQASGAFALRPASA
ncbi:MAG: hypothetical protein WDM92_03720 [Caulobacteraceae bacterium]